MRRHPCIPVNANGDTWSQSEVDSGAQMSLYSCPFMLDAQNACKFETNNRALYLHRVCSGVSDETHTNLYECFEKDYLRFSDRFALFAEALAMQERKNCRSLDYP